MDSQLDDEVVIDQPKSLVGGKLLNYQLEGLQWLLSLWENGLSGILADEMGLGKTIQIISLIAYLRERSIAGPYLIIGPLATIPNWINEFKKWLPIIDEGHRIKNRNCKLIADLKKVKSVNRLLLTGTPIQNTLDELWSLLNFCSPNIFDDLNVFQSWFGFKNIGKDTKVDDILASEQNTRIVSKLHEILRPFLLRRLKKDVLIHMPPKKEVVIYCPLTKLQKEYYYHVESNSIRDSLIGLGIENAKNDPIDPNSYLSEVSPEVLVHASGKFKLLDYMLEKLRSEKHKVLIFSQMTELLNILEDYITYKGYEYCRLDGDTKMDDKQLAIDSFNSNPSIFVFLLSTRAGGLGINLTSADTVVLFDSDWNPHQDSQAQDRCHRFGQTRPVAIYRLISLASIELSILDKQISKKKLERLTIT
eukprot:gene22332-28920_t